MSDEYIKQEFAQAQATESQLYAEIHRAEQARELLEHPLMQEAFNNIETTIIERWTTLATTDMAIRDTEGREKLWQMMQAVQGFRAQLRSVLETGQMARVQRDELQPLLKRLKEAIFPTSR
jgi:hypothetical protein